MNAKSTIIIVLLLILCAVFLLSDPRQDPAGDSPDKYRKSMETLTRIALVVNSYALDFGYAPKAATADELGKLLGPYMGALPRDEWAHEIQYRYDPSNPGRYWLASAGSDGEFRGFEQSGRWTSFQGQDVILTNEPPQWVFAPAVESLSLPDLPHIFGAGGNFQTNLNPEGALGIARRPPAAVPDRDKLEALPAYDPNSAKLWQVDLRGADVSGLDVRGRSKDLLNADFDSRTRWPKSLPPDFDPVRIMDMGKNPGLGLRKLHQLGITGKGVGVAVIDQTLLVDHAEYRGRLRLYEEIHNVNFQAAMHGPAVASIAVGRTVGVAPEADLYYIAETHGTFRAEGFDWDFAPLAQAVERILEVNRRLPEANRIRVISISVGWGPQAKGYAELAAALEKAKKENIFIVSSSLTETYDRRFYFHGLGREPLADPEAAGSYGPGSWWKMQFFSGKPLAPAGMERLLVPMDSRCTAGPAGIDDYAFYRQGGWSWSIPYIAGLYALACQVRPDMTPELFWAEALRTGETIEVAHNGKSYPFGKIINPDKLLKK